MHEVVLSFADEPYVAAVAARKLLRERAWSGEYVDVARTGQAAARVYWQNRTDREASRQVARSVLDYDSAFVVPFAFELASCARRKVVRGGLGMHGLLRAERALRRRVEAHVGLTAAVEAAFRDLLGKPGSIPDRFAPLVRYVVNDDLLLRMARGRRAVSRRAAALLFKGCDPERRLDLLRDPEIFGGRIRWAWRARRLSVPERTAISRERPEVRWFGFSTRSWTGAEGVTK